MTDPVAVKRLLLLRHAEAFGGMPDEERALTPRGQDDAAAVGTLLKQEGPQPELILCSPALRATQTLDGVLGSLPETPVRSVRDLYEDGPEAALREIRVADNAVETLLVIGHNPGIAALAGALAASGDSKAFASMAQDVPPAGLAIIYFTVSGWVEIEIGKGALDRFHRPGR